jgi:hypothetical protein
MNTISFDRLVEIENERQETMGNPQFQEWMKEMGVSIIYKDPEPRRKAKDMMVDYDFSKMFFRQNVFNIFK